MWSRKEKEKLDDSASVPYHLQLGWRKWAKKMLVPLTTSCACSWLGNQMKWRKTWRSGRSCRTGGAPCQQDEVAVRMTGATHSRASWSMLALLLHFYFLISCKILLGTNPHVESHRKRNKGEVMKFWVSSGDGINRQRNFEGIMWWEVSVWYTSELANYFFYAECLLLAWPLLIDCVSYGLNEWNKSVLLIRAYNKTRQL